MGKIGKANIKKTFSYLRRNGVMAAYHAVRERLGGNYHGDYTYRPPKDHVLDRQRGRKWERGPLFSIIVPIYRTPEKYLRAMVESVLHQTYANWQLLLTDATQGEDRRRTEEIILSYRDDRIRYIRKGENEGISANTNFALPYADGDYTGFLDHDDLLTPDALYEMASRIEEDIKTGKEPLLIYSDEDKCDREGNRFYEPHFKEDFNLDLLLGNNYICHFMVMQTGLLKKLKLRRKYDGAQDYDLVLRAVACILWRQEIGGEHERREGSGLSADEKGNGGRQSIAHIHKVLYHWRCHTGSTAENPHSKNYAYLAGQAALQDFAGKQGWKAKAEPLRHIGFYRLRYEPDILSNRLDVGAVGGGLSGKHMAIGGIYKADGSMPYAGLRKHFSGYMHKAALMQDADAVDIRLIHVREECRQLFARTVGVEYREAAGGNCFDYSLLPRETDFSKISLKLGETLRRAGYRIIWDPEWAESAKRKENAKSNGRYSKF